MTGGAARPPSRTIIPVVGLLVGGFAALVGGVSGGLVAVSHNRSPFGVRVVVEVPDLAP